MPSFEKIILFVEKMMPSLGFVRFSSVGVFLLHERVSLPFH